MLLVLLLCLARNTDGRDDYKDTYSTVVLVLYKYIELQRLLVVLCLVFGLLAVSPASPRSEPKIIPFRGCLEQNRDRAFVFNREWKKQEKSYSSTYVPVRTVFYSYAN
jgi:hypothetical protein